MAATKIHEGAIQEVKDGVHDWNGEELPYCDFDVFDFDHGRALRKAR